MSAEAAIQTAMLDLLRADAGVQAALGSPARIFDAETDQALLPYAQLERHEVTPGGASLINGYEHRLTLAMFGNQSLADTKAALAAVRAAIESAMWAVPGYTIILAHTVYSDVMRTPDRRLFRGLIRIRMISEEVG